MRRLLRAAYWVGAFIVVWAWATPASAGMPWIGLVEMREFRGQWIFLPLIGFPLGSFIMLRAWNALQRDFNWLPKLTFGRACLAMTVWISLFVVVLAMIVGARDLLTPGAWKKKLYTYEVSEYREDLDLFAELRPKGWRDRPDALLRLGKALILYAEDHGGAYPPSGDPSIPNELWRVPGADDLKFTYCPGRSRGDGKRPLAYEPAADGQTVCVLHASGELTFEQFEDVVHAAQSQDP